MQEPKPEDRLVQFPCTAARGVFTYGKLLSAVDPKGKGGLGFEGRLLKPGSTIWEAGLPEPAVMLEYIANPARERRKGRSEDLYILWLWDRKNREWREMGRAVARAGEWAAEIRPVAVRLLNPPGPRLVDYAGAANRVAAAIDQEMRIMTEPEAWEFLHQVYNVVAVRISAA